jgi:hypothetical protein
LLLSVILSTALFGKAPNVIDDRPDVAAKMTAAYEKFWKGGRPLMVNEHVPMSKLSPYHVWYEG